MKRLNNQVVSDAKKKVSGFMGKVDLGIRAFNFGFFLVSLLVWMYLTAIELLSTEFSFRLFWKAFNLMYAEFSFKVGCVFLILFNGLSSLRVWIFKYYDFKEILDNSKNLKKVLKHRVE